MGEKTFHISGQVVDRKRRTALRGLFVEAWDSESRKLSSRVVDCQVQVVDSL